jgi:AcrR family transcriptional regulator
MTAAVGSAPAHGGRPRDPDISRHILAATRELLTTDGYARMSMADVASRAGVHKPALYRRYGNKLEVTLAAIADLSPAMRDPDTGSVADDLVQIVLDIAPRDDTIALATLLRLRAEVRSVPELAEAVDRCLVAPKRAIVHEVLRRGVERGEVRGDVDPDLVADLVFGALQVRSQSGRHAPRRKEAAQIVATVLAGAAPRPSS